VKVLGKIRSYDLTDISDSDITETEFETWLQRSKELNLKLPGKATILRKKQDIGKLSIVHVPNKENHQVAIHEQSTCFEVEEPIILDPFTRKRTRPSMYTKPTLRY